MTIKVKLGAIRKATSHTSQSGQHKYRQEENLHVAWHSLESVESNFHQTNIVKTEEIEITCETKVKRKSEK